MKIANGVVWDLTEVYHPSLFPFSRCLLVSALAKSPERNHSRSIKKSSGNHQGIVKESPRNRPWFMKESSGNHRGTFWWTPLQNHQSARPKRNHYPGFIQYRNFYFSQLAGLAGTLYISHFAPSQNHLLCLFTVKESQAQKILLERHSPFVFFPLNFYRISQTHRPFWDLTDVTLADEDNNSIPTDDANTIDNNHRQCDNARGATLWPNL